METPPSAVDRLCDIDIPRAVLSPIKVDGKPREIVRRLTDAERSALGRRRGELQATIAPFSDIDQDRVAGAIFTMFGSFRSARQTGADAVGMVDGTKYALAKFPAWAIERGCLAIQRGEVKGLDRRYLPNDSEIVAVVADLVKPYERALSSACELLDAPVQAPMPRPAMLPAPSVQAPQAPVGDGKHALRVAAELAARRERREEAEREQANDDAGNLAAE